MIKIERELLSSRIGFLLVSAGCAIGLGNIWRFPYVAGHNGGAIFLFVYFFFLLALGLPLLIMEISLGRASRKNMGVAFIELEPRKPLWNKFGVISYLGSYLLLMFYIPVVGWLFKYCQASALGELASFTPRQAGQYFGNMLSDPLNMFLWTALVVALGFITCFFGIRNGVERIIKILMVGLLILLIVLAVHSLSLPGTAEGLSFYLAPNFERIQIVGFWNLLNDAMTQAFFTLGLGIGSMLIFGSYLDKKQSLTGEALYIVAIDTFVAIMAGIIIFPACFTYGVSPDSGPPLIFITLPNVFNSMEHGAIWGFLFFIFLALAALTTVIAVIENIISYSIDTWGWSRTKSIFYNFILLLLLTLPCILGFNVLAFVQPLGAGTSILDFEDFLLSKNLLPLGALVVILFCTHRYGWGYKKFVKEVNTGEGIRFPRGLRFYLAYILPLIVILVFALGYFSQFK